MNLYQHNLFPTLVFTATIENFEEINANILTKLFKCEHREEKVYGWQTQNIADWEELQPLIAQIDSYIKYIQTHMGYMQDDQLDSMWIQEYDKPHMLEKHKHPNSWYSGAYYLQADPECGPLSLHDHRPDVGIVSYPKNEENTDVSHRIEFKPEAGLLILFPSWCTHSVIMGKENTKRISLSFNWSKQFRNQNELTII
jgi:uncharacterized protein (TIGR02466 family)